MKGSEKPILVLSACLDLQPVRYNGDVVRDEFVLKLRNHSTVIPVCPEVGIGLGVPRPRIIVYLKDKKYRVFQPSTGRDLTQELEAFSRNFIQSLGQVDGFILKSKSPSCGVYNTKVYKDPEGKEFYGKGKGLMALEILKTFKGLPVEDEGRLHNPSLRDHFLTRIFALAHWRKVSQGANSIEDIVNFHRSYKYMLLAYSPTLLKRMGKLLAEYKGTQGLEELKSKYSKLFRSALAKKPHADMHVNALIHILGHLSDFLKPCERRRFLGVLEEFKKGKLPIKVPRKILKDWVYRFNDTYLLSQAYLEPYPEELG